MRLRLGPSIRTGRRPLRLADRERAETACTKEGSMMGIERKHIAPMFGAAWRRSAQHR